jgi:hypothetical protein
VYDCAYEEINRVSNVMTIMKWLAHTIEPGDSITWVADGHSGPLPRDAMPHAHVGKAGNPIFIPIAHTGAGTAWRCGMSYVTAAPEIMAATATDLAGIGSELREAHMAAAAPTVALVPAAADEVSSGVAHLFSRYAEEYQALSAQAVGFHAQFVRGLNAGASAYASSEAANASWLPALEQWLINAWSNEIGWQENALNAYLWDLYELDNSYPFLTPLLSLPKFAGWLALDVTYLEGLLAAGLVNLQ